MMLEHLQLEGEAERLMKAISGVLSEGKVRTPDIGGVSTTTQMTDAVLAHLR